ncbi:BCCT family transporter [Staphylococcus pseudoxylosus]|uniref:BCCT family transporter n=1 Tax=Staphylococcus pseudoxylosus TaxID=2282419 RepID=UPI002DB8B000|nr:BCCT family transporter [Staphylococcus pseudoxylosus]MEB7754898.1 BCCT family transporter [Staphylococcus pseudoxylosus]
MKKQVRWGVFLPISILVIITSLVGVLIPKAFYLSQTKIVDFIFTNFGWLFSLVTFLLIFICLYLGFSKYGKIRIGGTEAKPTMSAWQWFTISLTSGIGTGLLFWGAAEPIIHFMNTPDIGIKPGTEQAATFSMAAVTMQWTLAPYSLYVIFGMAVGYAHYNLKLPYNISSTLYPLIGNRAFGSIGIIVDILCMFAIAGSMSAILGEGVLQLSSGISHYTTIKDTPILWGIMVIAITLTYVISSYTGLDKGIRILADNNTKIFLFLLAFIFILGPTSYILNIGTQGTGKYLSSMAEMHLWLSPMDKLEWPRLWPIFEWSLWSANAPLIGMFLARLAYGRTLKQFVILNLLLPALFGCIWFWVFGGAAMHIDWKNKGILGKMIDTSDNGVQIALFKFLEYFPFSDIIGWVVLIAIYLSFTTLADSLTTTMASLTTKGNNLKNPEPPAKIKIFWGSLMGIMAFLIVTAGTGGEITGVDAVKQMATIAGFPILFLIIAIVIAFFKVLNKK